MRREKEGRKEKEKRKDERRKEKGERGWVRFVRLG